MNGFFVYALAVGVCLGTALTLLAGVAIAAAYISLVLAIVVLAFAILKNNRRAIIVVIVLLSIAGGVVRTTLFLRGEAQQTTSSYANQIVTIEGLVVSDPERREKSLHANISVSLVDSARARGIVRAILPRETTIFYGDTVRVRGKVVEPQPFQTSGGRVFAYDTYMRAQGISALIQRAELVQRTEGGMSLQGALFSLKHAFTISLEKLFPEPGASLLEGILIGERRGIPQSMTDEFIQSGLIHVVVLSGYNISIMSEAVFRSLQFLPRGMQFGVGGFAIMLFVLMTGAGTATVRAMLMGLIALLARYFHRSAIALRALALAAAGMVLWNPLSLLYDPSFVLSILATFGLITLSPRVEAHLPKFLEKFPSVKSIIASTIAVQIFVLPALLYYSGVLSFLSIPANALGLPVVPAAMLFGFLAGILGLVHPALGFVPMLVSDALLRWIMLVAHTAASFPYSWLTVPTFSVWIVVAVYIPLTAWAVWVYRKTEETN